ncbi:hypothetical protein [Vibrio zhanjiangensis]|nr:hypothetical protein [Vibrio zhanjiangensis]
MSRKYGYIEMTVKTIIVLVTLLQIIVATQSEGIVKALAELSAFLILVSLLLLAKAKRRNQPNEEQVFEH